MRPDDSKFATVPVGKLGIIVHPSCAELGKRIDQYIVNWRKEREHEHKENVVFKDYEQDTYIIDATCSRFGTGEAKALISDSVRGVDLYILADVLNYSLKYKVCGHENHMSPDDIYADVKRIIGAASGKPKSITVIMPFLYESRQHKRSSRESLDCAYALQELTAIGVDNVLTFDAHDPRVQNAIPLKGFDNIMPTYQFIKALLRSTSDLEIDNEHLMVISPDEGAMNRTMYFSSVLGVDIGMFYKRRDYSVVVDGRNPIVAHEFLGASVEGKDVMIIDDMISTGHARALLAIEDKEQQYILANKVFDEKLSVRDTEKLVKELKKPKKEKEKPAIQNAFVYEDLEERIKSIIGSKVHVNHKANGKGKIEIEYYSDNDLERIFELLMSIQEGK